MENVSSSNSHEGLVPKLRFPEFQGEWTEIRFNELFTMLSNNTLSRAELSDNGNIYNMHYGDVLIKFGDTVSPYIDTIPYIADTSKTKHIGDFLQDGDIIIADTAEDSTVGKATEITEFREKQVVSGLHTIPCRPSFEFSSGYLGYYLNSSHYHTQLIPLMQGIKVTSISKSNISQTLIRYPNKAEQEKISALIQLIDIRLRKQRELIEHLKSYKRGVLSAIFDRKLRFNNNYPEWVVEPLSEIFAKITHRNTDNNIVNVVTKKIYHL